mgnify:CR=1 FL=1
MRPRAAAGVDLRMPALDELLLFPGPPPTTNPASIGRPDYREVRFPNGNGRELHGWFLPATAADPVGTVLISHGNGGNIGRFLPWADASAGPDRNVFLYDYQGFGGSEGRPEIASLAGDGRAALAHVLGRTDPGCRRVVLFGLSLGTVVSLAVAAAGRPEIAGLVLEGAFSPRIEAARIFGAAAAALIPLPPGVVPERHAAGLTAPSLFLQAGADAVTSTEGARKLYEAAGGEKDWREWPGAAHLQPVFADPVGYRQVLRSFLSRVLAG